MERSLEDVLVEELGLSRNEAKVYTALLHLGSVPVGKIASESKIHRTNVYDTLDRLIEKGLVSYVQKDDVKHYQATEPDNLFSIIREKEARLQSLLPQLHFSQRAKKSTVHVYEGKTPIKNMLNRFLEQGKPIDVFGIPKEVPEILKHFLPGFHARRVKKEIPMRHIYNLDAIERINHLNTLPCTEARSLPKSYDSPVSTLIAGDLVVLTLFSQDLLVILIESASLARSYRNYFNLLWKLAKVPS